ncbi:ABC transporter ATP-binding protein [Candidatus Kaiserbacteria bacterium]|nr:ABC transporter ATP-binding protein [Candidatus Kaiserbacteria bacterium]
MNIIETVGLRKTFTNGDVEQEVLKGVDVSVAAGEFVAIMGRSGAGKSTLLYQLSALDEPTTGRVVVDGQDLSLMTEAEVTEFRLYTMGYVFQDYALIPDLSAAENIITPLLMRGIAWGEAEELALAALDAVGLTTKANNLPSQLSGGEQQRVSIARAIAGRPKIIFADEPTANLDSVSGKAVIDLLISLHRTYKQTIVMVTHEAEYTAFCDRVIHLEDGQIMIEETAMRPPVTSS